MIIIVNIETENHGSEFPLCDPWKHGEYTMERKTRRYDDDDNDDDEDMLRCGINYYD